MDSVTSARRASPTLPPEAPVAEWRVLRPIGRGGAATVYEAEHTRTGRHVAMKVVDIDLRGRGDLRLRFERELRTMSSIDDPHVPQVVDFGELDNGAPYVVLEQLDGETLERRLDREPMSIEEVVWLARELLTALAAVHRHEVVHRDVKPANIFLNREADGGRTLKLLDFGVCFPLRDLGCPIRVTRGRDLVGTAGYVAPELLRGDDPDPRADLYSVGAVLYEALTGVPPHTGESWSQIVLRVLSEEPVPIRQLRKGCPIGLERFVRLALDRSPARRFRSAMEMLACLEDVRAGGVPVRPDECLWRVRCEPGLPSFHDKIPWRVLTLIAFAAAGVGTALGLLAF